MNETEMKTLATFENVAFAKYRYSKASCIYYYLLASKKRKAGDKKSAKSFWSIAKDYCRESEKNYYSWVSLYSLKNKLRVDNVQYYNSVDKKVVDPIKEQCAKIEVSIPSYDYDFIALMQTVIKGGK